jgi:HEPN domain-containing protein
VNKKELINYWIKSSDKDFKTMNNLFKSRDYHWALFLGHLVIEKLLKAYFVKKVNDYPPYTHNLLQIATKADLPINGTQKDFLDLLTSFNIAARYADYKLQFYKKCTRQFTEINISKIKELRLWLKNIIKK